MALVPQDDGEPGELRLAIVGHLQHRVYKPKPNGVPQYTNIFVGQVDVEQTDVIGCDTRVVTLDDFEYWFRFPSDSDATIFYRVLCHKMDLAELGEWDENEEDYWEEGPWTVNEVVSDHLECRCYCHGHIRYAADYSV